MPNAPHPQPLSRLRERGAVLSEGATTLSRKRERVADRPGEGRSNSADTLFPHLTAFPHLLESLQRAASGKRNKRGVAAFLARQESALIHLRDQLQSGAWRGGGYTVIEISDPKPRRISAAPFADRVVHHALCSVIAPIFERGFIADSYANRVGYGQHRAVARYEHYRDRYAYVLRCDIYRYFPSIDHQILKRDYRRRITCERTLALMDVIVDGSNPQEPVNLIFPGDDLLTAAERRRGLPLGNLTSQLFGNLYLNGFDHFVKEVLRAPYLRFVDDFALFAHDRATLERWQAQIATYLAGRRLILHPRKTFIAATAEPAQFLGYVLHRGGLRTLPPENVQRFCGRLQSLRTRWKNGEQNESAIRQRIQSWIAHASHADTWRLRQTLFRGGWFDPALLNRQPLQLPVRPELVEGRAHLASAHVSTSSTRTVMGLIADSTEALPTRAAWRLVEQRTTELARGESQQQRPCETEQQQRLPSCQIAPTSEPGGSWAIWAHERAFRVGWEMAAPAVRFGREATDGVPALPPSPTGGGNEGEGLYSGATRKPSPPAPLPVGEGSFPSVPT
ncbi:MAG: hypothetical protein HY849_02560 [Nitrosomonadales bacterium]|nr:hypothetical protein [Nitrosomonadales bacterium]